MPNSQRFPRLSRQQQQTLKALTESGKQGITQLEVGGRYRIRSLTSRIAELRKLGYKIHGSWKLDSEGQRYKRYRLLQVPA